MERTQKSKLTYVMRVSSEEKLFLEMIRGFTVRQKSHIDVTLYTDILKQIEHNDTLDKHGIENTLGEERYEILSRFKKSFAEV